MPRLDSVNPLPLVSVICPIYNGEKYLAVAIESVLDQTLKDFEFIMIDDGSTDGSLKILQKYAQQDSRIRLMSRSNKGVPSTLNEMVSMSSASFIARMDQDDICHPERLRQQYEYLKNNNDVVVLGSAAVLTDSQAHPVCTYFPVTEDEQLRLLFPDSPFVHPTVMFRKDMFEKAGKYPEQMILGGEDVILFSNFTKFGKLHNLNKALLAYRLVPGSLSRKPPEFRNLLTSIINDQLAGLPFDHEKFAQLKLISKAISKTNAIFDYHFEIAKLYIWSGGLRAHSLKHLAECRTFQKPSAKVMFMYFLAYMPSDLIKSIFFKLKGRFYKKHDGLKLFELNE